MAKKQKKSQTNGLNIRNFPKKLRRACKKAALDSRHETLREWVIEKLTAASGWDGKNGV